MRFRNVEPRFLSLVVSNSVCGQFLPGSQQQINFGNCCCSPINKISFKITQSDIWYCCALSCTIHFWRPWPIWRTLETVDSRRMPASNVFLSTSYIPCVIKSVSDILCQLHRLLYNKETECCRWMEVAQTSNQISAGCVIIRLIR